jgi:hypothetical protein
VPGTWITNKQVEIYMKSRKSGYNQTVSSAKSGISERSGRDIEHDKRVSSKPTRQGRTRRDPFLSAWESEIVPLLEKSPTLQPLTILEHLQTKYLDKNNNPIYSDSLLRTLQRRVKNWKAKYGPEKEVMFLQTHIAGRLGLSDFTHLKNVIITINGEKLKHILYHFRLAFSHWSHMKVVLGGESFTALAEGLQGALWRLGGSPLEHRTDSLSAAFKNMSKDSKIDVTERYKELCSHYSMQATRNNLGAKHENGSVESAHGHLKRRIEQSLLIRESNDFASIQDYQSWVDSVVNQHNRRNAQSITLEKKELQSLPTYKTVEYTETTATVTSSSTIDVRRILYTVPSRLEGETLRVLIYDDKLLCYLGNSMVVNLKRIYPSTSISRGYNINYKHVIHSLVKKPQAFRLSRIREHLLPNNDYKRIWQYVDQTLEAKSACRFIVGILHLAAQENCEAKLSASLLKDIERKKELKLCDYQVKFIPREIKPPDIKVSQHLLTNYNYLIPTEQEAHNV